MSDEPEKVVGYCRVSTDDKGQDPKRQEEILSGWARGNKLELVAVVYDEGTSGSVSPLARKKVKEAIRLAQERGATALAVETADRWTRAGLEDGVMSRAALLQEHRLKLYMADVPFSWDRLMQDIMLAIRDAMAADWLRKHRARVAQGLRRAKEKGWPAGKPGRPPKEPLNLEEQAMVRAWRDQRVGWATIAVRISQHRGAFEVADTKVARERRVSSIWVKEQVAALSAARGLLGPGGAETVAISSGPADSERGALASPVDVVSDRKVVP